MQNKIRLPSYDKVNMRPATKMPDCPVCHSDELGMLAADHALCYQCRTEFTRLYKDSDWFEYRDDMNPQEIKMSQYKLSNRSWDRLKAVHPHLVAVVARALMICSIDFGVSEGMRSVQRQRELYNDGKSQTMNSRHLSGHAVDLYAWVDGKASWEKEHFEIISQAMFQAAAELDVVIEWGGNWTSFYDGPHFQLPSHIL